MKSATNINNSIRSSKVLLITNTGENLGIINTSEALSRARVEGLDLVEVGENKNIPVCKIMDYGKWKYDQIKKTKKNKSSAPKQVIKEMKLRPNTADNDLQYRAKQAGEFLKEGNKVKLSVHFKGREEEHMFATGKAMLEKFLSKMVENFVIEENAKVDTKVIYILIGPEK